MTRIDIAAFLLGICFCLACTLVYLLASLAQDPWKWKR